MSQTVENQTVSCIYNGVFNNHDSNMQLFIGSAPGDDYYRFGKIRFLYATSDVDTTEYGVKT